MPVLVNVKNPIKKDIEPKYTDVVVSKDKWVGVVVI
jgi:hypothetical protein